MENTVVKSMWQYLLKDKLLIQQCERECEKEDETNPHLNNY